MNRSFNQESARIYQFPTERRGRHHDDAKSAFDRNTPRVNETICSGSWYHEEAIQEDKQKRDR
jgi:uncharacterized protein DUF2735